MENAMYQLDWQYTIQGNDGNSLDFICVMMIDPAIDWIKMEQTLILGIILKSENVTRE